MSQSAEEDRGTNESNNTYFGDILQARIRRRSLLRGVAFGAPLMVMGSTLAACDDDEPSASSATADFSLQFSPIAPNLDDKVTVPSGYEAQVLLRWGDSLKEGTPSLGTDTNSLSNQTAAQQANRFGYNSDFVGYFPLKDYNSKNSASGLLAVNHEYTNPELMFPGYDAKTVTRAQAEVELAAHGMSVVEVSRDDKGKWTYKLNSSYNRRLTGESPMELTGPAAGNELLRTAADSTGTKVAGMLNNCGGGKTPWGTVLTAEENFNQYFSNLNGMDDANPKKAIHRRYGLTAAGSEKGWENFFDRFNLTKEPNEPFRFGWVVEIDPYDPTWTPKKRTALGRLKHEAATTVVAPNKSVVIYTGDDERFDYMYKFVTADKYNEKDRKANFNLLDKGTLYVAKFNEDGTGQWLPLIAGQGGLTAAAGFASQADVLIKTRLAGDAVGATKMDRPEDIETDPVNGKVYAIMTNNTNRTAEQVSKSNPRPSNRHGHIIEIAESGSDHTATTFNWEIFLLAGDPKVEADGSYFAGYDKTKVSWLSCPDNLCFGAGGHMWIATDGATGTLRTADGIYAVPVQGAERGFLRAFLTGPVDCEICGPEFTTDFTTLFAAVQHPGEKAGSTVASPTSKWPDGTGVPRPSVVAIVKTGGGIVGS